MPAIPAQLHAPGEAIDGFTVRSVDPVPEVRGRAYRIDHRASGARILHVHCDDPENLFSINFPTPPPDDTGLPHILEHVVLAGSKRFPVREPFFEMLKMSMATFINAMTAPDCTYYPVASNTRKDLFNLAEVYFDAVFHPLLTEDSFKREGHHLAPADPDDPSGALSVTGIVYNEMKGAYSSPLARLHRGAMRKLLPDTIYGRSSGGEPEAIPRPLLRLLPPLSCRPLPARQRVLLPVRRHPDAGLPGLPQRPAGRPDESAAGHRPGTAAALVGGTPLRRHLSDRAGRVDRRQDLPAPGVAGRGRHRRRRLDRVVSA